MGAFQGGADRLLLAGHAHRPQVRGFGRRRRRGRARGRGSLQVGRQVVQADALAGAEDKAVLDDVFQLADVAGEVVGHEPRQGRRFEPGHGAAAQPVHAVDAPLHQQGDVLAPRAQGRQLQPDHVDPVEQVAAESALGHQRLQVPVGGREDAHVHPFTFCCPERLELPLLEHAQQFHLEGRAGLADLVEQDGAALGERKIAGLVALGAGEGAGTVAEQFGFEQGVGQGAAVDGHERPVAARAEVVQGSGE